MESRDIDILGISETKLSINNKNYAFKNSLNYKCFLSVGSTQTYGSGVAIIMKKDLAKHVGHITKIEEHVLAVHMLFKKSKLYIIQVYLPSNKRSSNKYQHTIRKIIMEEMKIKFKIILMGDFNTVRNPQTDRPHKINKRLSWKPEIEIFNFLNDWAFVDIQEVWEEDSITHTWSNKITSSRIDYIWLSASIASNNIHSFNNIKAESIANSDHTLLNVKLFSNNIFDIQKPKVAKRKKKITIINSKNATKEQWKDFQEKVDVNLDKPNISKLIKSYQQSEENWDNKTQSNNGTQTIKEDKLEKIWLMFQNCLIKAAKLMLPLKKIKTNCENSDKKSSIISEHKKY